MASSANSWMPAHGRHQVNIGTSLGRALKARKLKGGAPPAPVATKRSNLPDRDFYSFRYNFKPPSIDATRPGTIEVRRGVDKASASVTVEHPSSQTGEGHAFVGAEHPAKEWECVLIYDEETGTFTLEKLDSYMNLTYQRKMAMTATRAPASPLPPPPEPSKSAQRALNYEEELERELLGEDEDAHGEVDEELNEAVPDSIALREEEEEEEELYEPPEPQPPPPPPKSKQVRPAKPAPAPTPAPPAAKTRTVAPLPSKPAKQATQAPPKPRKTKPPASAAPQPQPQPAPPPPPQHLSDAEEEELEFGKPPKRARHLSPPPKPLSDSMSPGLALPGGVDAHAPPPAAAVYSRDSESEEEWDEVQPPAAAAATDEADVDVFGDHFVGAGGDDGEGEEIDVSAFELELNMQMEESDAEGEEDFLVAVVSPEPEGEEQQQRVPISLKQLAAGAEGAAYSDDEYSSSEESDDD